MARQVRPWQAEPIQGKERKARAIDQEPASEFHQGQRLRPQSKVRIYGCNLNLLTVID
jgi:hypothetical protein